MTININMKHLKIIFLIAAFFAAETIQCGVFIVVHGTWGTASAWSAPGGAFFDELEAYARQCGHRTITYTWSGYLDESHRAAAGKGLAKLIRSYPSKTEFYIVAHSHGGNVAIMASQELAQYAENRHRIKAMYVLGTPVEYMGVIDYFYNLFSLNDLVQPVLGFFNRTYPFHERIGNIRVRINGKEPDHYSIHHAAIARWLPRLHDMLVNLECSPAFALHTPGIIDFFDTAKPQYTVDIERKKLLEKDSSMQKRMLALFRQQQLRVPITK